MIMPNAMIHTRNLYENKLIMEMMNPDLNAPKIESLVDEYTQMRLKGVMLDKRFAQAMQTDNAHIYMKMLREQVVLELGLNKDTKAS